VSDDEIVAKIFPGVVVSLQLAGDKHDVLPCFLLREISRAIRPTADGDVADEIPGQQASFAQECIVFLDEHYPNAERIARRGFYLPSGLALTEEKIIKVTTALKDTIKEFL
jgi:hypothetical protein